MNVVCAYVAASDSRHSRPQNETPSAAGTALTVPNAHFSDCDMKQLCHLHSAAGDVKAYICMQRGSCFFRCPSECGRF